MKQNSLGFFNHLFRVAINSSVANLIMENLWETKDPELSQTVPFRFHWLLKLKKLAVSLLT